MTRAVFGRWLQDGVTLAVATLLAMPPVYAAETKLDETQQDNVTSPYITDATIATADVADGAITTPKLAADAVTSAKILNGEIVNADLSSSAAIADTKLATISTAGKVADSALSANVTKQGTTIESAEITDGTIVATNLAADSVTSAKILDGTIVAAGLATDAVTSA